MSVSPQNQESHDAPHNSNSQDHIFTQQEEQLFNEFTKYDWESDLKFNKGLKEVYNSYFRKNSTLTNEEKENLINKTKVFYYMKSFGQMVDINKIREWQLINELNKTEKYIESSAKNSGQKPLSYQDLIEFISSGKQIPGIKQIPDTVLADKASESKLKPRLKPWELQSHKDENELDFSIDTASPVDKSL